MSMFNDTSWGSKDNKKECESSAREEGDGRQGRRLGETSCELRVSLWMRMKRTQTETQDPMRSLTEVSQCRGSQLRTLRHKATSQEGVMNFMRLFNNLEGVGTVQKTTPEALRK